MLTRRTRDVGKAKVRCSLGGTGMDRWLVLKSPIKTRLLTHVAHCERCQRHSGCPLCIRNARVAYQVVCIKSWLCGLDMPFHQKVLCRLSGEMSIAHYRVCTRARHFLVQTKACWYAWGPIPGHITAGSCTSLTFEKSVNSRSYLAKHGIPERAMRESLRHHLV